MPVTKFPEMGTINEAAARSGLSRDRIRKMCIRNEIVHIRSGKKYLINLDKLAEYLETGGTQK